METYLIALSLANLAGLLYLIFRAQYAASLPFAQALAQKEAELIVLRQTVMEARNAFAIMRAQQAEAKPDEAKKGVAKSK